jgi:hypothetical protein
MELEDQVMSEDTQGEDPLGDASLQIHNGETEGKKSPEATEDIEVIGDNDPVTLNSEPIVEPGKIPVTDTPARKRGRPPAEDGVLDLHDNEEVPDPESWTKVNRNSKPNNNPRARPGYEKKMTMGEIQNYESPEIKRLIDNTKRHEIKTRWSDRIPGWEGFVKTANPQLVKKYRSECFPIGIHRATVQASHPISFRQDRGQNSSVLIFILMDVKYGPIFVEAGETPYTPFSEEDLTGMDEILEKRHPIIGPAGRTEYVFDKIPCHGLLVEYPMTIITTRDQGAGNTPEWFNIILNVTHQRMKLAKPILVGDADEHKPPMFRLIATTPEILMGKGLITPSNFLNIIPPLNNKDPYPKTPRHAAVERIERRENWRKRDNIDLDTTPLYSNPSIQPNRSLERNMWNGNGDLRMNMRTPPRPHYPDARYATPFIEWVLNQEDDRTRELYMLSSEWLMTHLIHLSSDLHNAFVRKMRMDYLVVAPCCCNICLKDYRPKIKTNRLERTNFSDEKYSADERDRDNEN